MIYKTSFVKILGFLFLVGIARIGQPASDKVTGLERSYIDPVVLENEWLKATVDCGRGGVIRSLIHKPTGRELVEEFHWGGAWSGGIGEDILAGQGYPGKEMQQARYKGQVKKGDKETFLSMNYSSESSANKGLKFVKTIRLRNGESKIEIGWTIENVGKKEVAVTPWVHNVVHRSLADTLLPKADGIAVISGGADYFCVAHRNWIGAMDRKNKLLVYFSYDFNEVARNYYSFWNGYHSVEWVSCGKKLKPGESWLGSYCVGVVEGLDNVAYVSPDVAVGYNWQGEQLFLDLVAVRNMKNVEVSLTPLGKENISWKEMIEIGPRRSTKVKVPFNNWGSNSVTLSFQLKENGREAVPGRSCNLPEPNPTLHVVKGLMPDKVPLPQWSRTRSIYQKRMPGKVMAEAVGSIDRLSFWWVDPLVKVFPNDQLLPAVVVKDNFGIKPISAPQVVAARGERETFQIVIHNEGSKPQQIRCELSAFISPVDKNQRFESGKIARVAYVETRTPSGLDSSCPIGEYPDPLVPANDLSVPAGRNQPIWISVVVPHDTQSGIYQAELCLVVGNKKTVVPLTMEVLDFTLPKTASLKTDFGCWLVSDDVLKQVGYKGTSREFWKLCEANYLEHRITPREKEINFAASTEKFSESVKRYMSRGASSLHVPTSIATDEKRLRHVTKVLREQGMMERAFIYAYDEIPANMFPEFAKFCNSIHKISPDLKILGTIYVDNPELLYGSVNIWCRDISNSSWIRQRQKAGDEFWTVNPGVSLEGDLLDLRRKYWRMKTHGYSGALMWNCVGGYGKDNPWKDALCSGINGNAHLLWPTSCGPVDSIRWTTITDAIEDYDYLQILSRLISEAKAKKLSPALSARAEELFNCLDKDVMFTRAELLAIRETIGREIVQLQKALDGKLLVPHQPVPPQGPGAYELPKNAIRVTNVAELKAMLERKEPCDIILADGEYENATHVSFGVPHRLWAEHVGKTVLKFGFAVGAKTGKGGAEIHGLKFDISDSRRTYKGACIYVWGSGTGCVITDCRFEGHGKLDSAIMARTVDGLRVQKAVIRNFLSWGIYACDYPEKKNPSIPILIEDIDIDGISQSKPRSSNGTAEAGIWLGNQGKVNRVKIRNCAIMSVWTGSACNDSVIENSDIDGSPVGIYIENITRRSVFRRFRIGPAVETGINGEWNLHDPNLGGDSNTICDGLIDAADKGIYLDQGTKNTRVERVTIRNAKWGGIGMYRSPTSWYRLCSFDLPIGVRHFRRDNWLMPADADTFKNYKRSYDMNKSVGGGGNRIDSMSNN